MRFEQTLAVVGHLSEGIPRYWLLDSVALQQFVDNELTFGLRLAVEAKVLTDANATSAIQTQADATSALAIQRTAWLSWRPLATPLARCCYGPELGRRGAGASPPAHADPGRA